MNGGGVVPDGMLASEEDPGRVLDHVVGLAGVAGDDGRGEYVVVVAGGAGGHEAVGAARPGVSAPPRHHGLLGHGHRVVAKDSCFEK